MTIFCRMRLRRSIVALPVLVALAIPALALAGGKHQFAPSVDAPWANYGAGHGKNSDKAATGLCRSNPFDLTGAYGAFGSPEVNAIVGDQINNSGVSNFGCTTPQNETTIAVNPMNPQNLIAGANDYRVVNPVTGLNDGSGWAYASFDGGQSWVNVQLPGLVVQTGGKGVFKKFNSAGDPVITFSPDGIAYYANIVFNRNGNDSGVVVSVSRDGGATWSDPSLVTSTDTGVFFHDKEWIGAGANGQVVVTWTRFNQGAHGAGYIDSPIVMASSGDYGKTWNRTGSPVSDKSHPYNQGSQVQFGPDGALYVAYEGSSPATAFATDALVLARSTDGGKNFSTKEVARVYDDLDCYPVFNGRQTLTNMHFRLNSYPSMTIDPTNGRIAIVWADNEGVGNCGTGAATYDGTATSAQVKLVSGTWASLSGVVKVTASEADKVFPAVAANNGKLAISYYTRDYVGTHDPDVCNIRIGDAPAPGVPNPEFINYSVCLDYAAVSSVNGLTFGSQLRLTSEGSNPFIQFADGAFIGDYTQVAMGSDGVAQAAWTDFRGRPGTTRANQDVVVRSFTP